MSIPSSSSSTTAPTTGSNLRLPKKSSAECEQNQEWENHVVMRFPPEIATKVREYLDEDVSHGHDSRMNLNFNSDLRTGTVKFDKHEMNFSLYNLPTITEVMKTLDNKTLYKVADISQMILCLPPGEKAPPPIASEVADKVAEEPSNNEWPHGLCPPMRNVRRKRFRKIKRKKYMDAADVERELKRLLRSDLEAFSVRWEVVSSEEPENMGNEMPELQAEPNEETNQQQPLAEEYGLSLSESEEDDLNTS